MLGLFFFFSLRCSAMSPFHLSELAHISFDMQVGQHAETAICPRVLPSDMHAATLHRSPCKCISL